MLLPCATCTTEVAEISHDDYAAGWLPIGPQCARREAEFEERHGMSREEYYAIEEAEEEWLREAYQLGNYEDE